MKALAILGIVLFWVIVFAATFHQIVMEWFNLLKGLFS